MSSSQNHVQAQSLAYPSTDMNHGNSRRQSGNHDDATHLSEVLISPQEGRVNFSRLNLQPFFINNF
jgi:hypothetical protein